MMMMMMIYTEAISTFLHTMKSSFLKHERDGGGGLLHGSEQDSGLLPLQGSKAPQNTLITLAHGLVKPQQPQLQN